MPARPATASGTSARAAAPRRRVYRAVVRPVCRVPRRSCHVSLRECERLSSMSRLTAPHASPYLLLTLTSLFWSLNWVIGRAAVGHVSPFALTFARWFVAVAVMMPFAWPMVRANWPVIRRNWKTIVWLGFWGTGLHNAFAYVGLQYTTATN